MPDGTQRHARKQNCDKLCGNQNAKADDRPDDARRHQHNQRDAGNTAQILIAFADGKNLALIGERFREMIEHRIKRCRYGIIDKYADKGAGLPTTAGR